MPVEQHVTYCRICEALCGLIATVEDGRLQSLAAGSRQSVVAGPGLPEGYCIHRHPERHRPGAVSAASTCGRHLRGGQLGRGARRHRCPAHPHRRRPRRQRGRPVLRQPHRVRLRHRTVVGNLPHPPRRPPPVLVGLAGHQLALRREQAAVRGGQPDPVPGPAAHRLPVHARAPIRWCRTEARCAHRASRTIWPGSPAVAAGWWSSTRAAPKPPAPTNICRCARTPTPGCCCRCCTSSSTRTSPTPPRWPSRRRAGRHCATSCAASRPKTPRPAPASTPTCSADSPATSPPRLRAVAYGRTGACLGRHGTLVCFLLDALSIVTGNLDRAGGMLFAQAVIPLEDMGEKAGRLTYNTSRSRVGDLPEVISTYPGRADRRGDHHPRRRPDARHVRHRRQPGADRAQRADAREGARRTRICWCRWISTSTRPTATPTTCCPRRRSSSVTTCPTASRTARRRCSSRRPNRCSRRTATPATNGRCSTSWPAGWSFRCSPRVRWSASTGSLTWLDRRGIGRITPRRVVELLMRIGPYGDRFGLRRNGINPRRLGEPTRHRAGRACPRRYSHRRGAALRRQGRSRARRRSCRGEQPRRPPSRRSRLPADGHRHARDAFAELVDAQQPDADEGQSSPPRQDQPRRRRGREPDRRRQGADHLAVRRHRDRGRRSPTTWRREPWRSRTAGGIGVAGSWRTVPAAPTSTS